MVLAVVAIVLALSGAGLIALAILFAPAGPQPLLWYEQDGKVFRFDPGKHTSEQVMALPLFGRSPGPRPLSADGLFLAVTDDRGLNILRVKDAQVVLEVPHKGDDPSQLSLTNSAYIPLLWSPDNHWLLIQMWRYEQQGLGFLDLNDGTISEADGIYVSQPDGTRARLLVPGNDQTPIATSPDDAYLTTGIRSSDSVRSFVEPYPVNGLWVFDLRNDGEVYVGPGQFIGWQMSTN